MNIIILTQSDPICLAENIVYLIKRLPTHSKIVSAVVSMYHPFGRKEGCLEKIKRTISVFGIRFFLRYSYEYILNGFKPYKSVSRVFSKNEIPIISLDKSVNAPNSLSEIRKYKPDLLISIAGNQIFKQPLIDLASKGCLNLNTALLPKYRFLMPLFMVLKNNELENGVSVFLSIKDLIVVSFWSKRRFPYITVCLRQS